MNNIILALLFLALVTPLFWDDGVVWVMIILAGAIVVKIARSIRDNRENDNRENEVPAPRLVGEGCAHIRNRDYDKAIKSFERAIEIDPNFAPAYNGLGLAYGNKGEYDEEIKAYKNAIEKDPRYLVAYRNLGIAYRDKREYGESVKAYNKAIEKDPRYAPAYNGLGYTYAAMREWYKAINAYERALEIAPNYADARKNLDDANSHIRARQATRPTIYRDEAYSHIRPTSPYHYLDEKGQVRCRLCQARDGKDKRVYESKADAQSTIDYWERRGEELYAYDDTPCGKWHLTSQPRD